MIMKKVLTTFLIFMLLVPQIEAQKVGVVLSGGGARGLAHIGLLKALEENNIPIDYICGTSIGAIIGSLYAIGYTPEQMYEFLGSEDFLRWSKGEISIKEQYYYKTKQEDAKLVSTSLKYEDGAMNVVLPTNLINPIQMDYRFMEMYARASAKADNNFDNLLVPFFCVSTDVYANKPVIFTSGDLSQAVRTSMTFPGYFKPLVIDSVMLFDGGMQDNFPVEIMKERYNPDVIIGCTVSENPEKPTVEDPIMVVMNVFMKKTNYKVPENGVLIAPKVTKYGIMDFDKIGEINKLGYDATYAKMDSIKLLVQRRENSDSLAAKRQAFVNSCPQYTFQNVIVKGAKKQAADYIEQSIKRGRDTFDRKDLESGYFKITTDRLLESVVPKAVYNKETGFFDLHLDVTTRNSLTMKFGGNISSGNRSFGQIGAEYLFMRRNIHAASVGVTAGQFYSSATAAYRIDLTPRSIAKTIPPYFVDIRATYNSWNYFKTSNELFFDSESLSQLLHTDKYIGVGLGKASGTRGITSLDIAYGNDYYEYFHSSTITKKDSPDQTSYGYFNVKLNYEYSTLNFRQYPSRGRYIAVQGSYILGNETYKPGSTSRIFEGAESIHDYHEWFNVKGTFEQYHNLAKHFTLGYKVMFNANNKPKFSNSIASLLMSYAYNGFVQCQSQILENYRADIWVGTGLIPIINIGERVQFRMETHVFQPYKCVNTKEYKTTYSKTFPQPKFMANWAFVWQTPIGPLAVTTSYYPSEEKQFYTQVNLGYLLFNRAGGE